VINLIQLAPFLELKDNIYNKIRKEVKIDVSPYESKDINFQANKFFRNVKNVAMFSGLVNLTTEGVDLPEIIDEMRHANSTSDFQNAYIKIVQGMHKNTVTDFEVRGLENLDKNKSYQYISNHDNILMNPYDISLALMLNGFNAPNTVAGDNLANSSFFNSLLKLLGTIIVVRGNPTHSQTLDFCDEHYETRKKETSLWIAQASGRSKYNINITDPSIIRSITHSQLKDGFSLSEVVNGYFVPVSISKEYEPCDILMAKEVIKTQNKLGKYDKGKLEDAWSMFMGVKGYKGKMVVEFGKPLDGDFSKNKIIGSKQVAKALDEQIINNYHFFDTHNYAYNILTKPKEEIKDVPNPFESRLRLKSSAVKRKVYMYYANPVAQKNEK